jgi:hypothetical protein
LTTGQSGVKILKRGTEDFMAWGIAMRQRFVFRIRTKSGGIVGNIVIEAKDQYEAEHKLRQRYPDCEILNCETK